MFVLDRQPAAAIPAGHHDSPLRREVSALALWNPGPPSWREGPSSNSDECVDNLRGIDHPLVREHCDQVVEGDDAHVSQGGVSTTLAHKAHDGQRGSAKSVLDAVGIKPERLEIDSLREDDARLTLTVK